MLMLRTNRGTGTLERAAATGGLAFAQGRLRWVADGQARAARCQAERRAPPPRIRNAARPRRRGTANAGARRCMMYAAITNSIVA